LTNDDMSELIDIHHHVLYGLDDGPPKKADMEKMLDTAWREGVRVIIATPHVSPGIAPFSLETIEQRAAEGRTTAARPATPCACCPARKCCTPIRRTGTWRRGGYRRWEAATSC
jgi:tyrosine-protein phosphatase YwqE